jgi:hypothetical protein
VNCGSGRAAAVLIEGMQAMGFAYGAARAWPQAHR